MGLFLAMSEVVAGSTGAVVEALRAYAEGNGGTLEEAAATTDHCLSIGEGAGGVTVVYPDGFLGWDSASQALSERLGKPVFSFHVHDGDLWMYLLYERGAVVDQFNPVPGYWEEIGEEERRCWLGDAHKVASSVPGLVPEQISDYLVQWDDLLLLWKEPRKAYATDRFHYGEDWQLIDFMDKLGLAYPDSDRDGPRATYRSPAPGDGRSTPRGGQERRGQLMAEC
jgi:hypothetical protein